jgi:exopolysaccharide biosynthesis protein
MLFCFGMLSSCFVFAQKEQNNPGLDYQVIQKNGHQIYLLDIDPKYYKILPVRAQSNSTKRQTVSSTVSSHKAMAGINGGYFYITQKGEGKPAGALKIHEWLSVPIKARGVIGWNENTPKVMVDRLQTKSKRTPEGKREVDVFPQVDKSPNAKKTWGNFDFIVGGTPLLIKDGHIIKDHTSEKTLQSFLTERHARTAVCIKKNGHWLWLVASHTKKECRPYVEEMVEGFTISELADFLHTQGCVQALNLDGGGSSTLVLNNKVMNTPAGDCDDFIHFYHERPVSDAILLFPK